MTLQQLFTDELHGLYDVERQLAEALPRMAAAAHGQALRAVLTSHLEETRMHLTRLRETFALLGRQPDGRRCLGMAGILAEGSRLLDDASLPGAVRDAGLIAGAQKAQHYEMCAYGTCVAWARALGLHQIAARLEETLIEEKAADQALSDLAVQEVNVSATHEPT
jgi:ferritin-like metal-binding protein YciE